CFPCGPAHSCAASARSDVRSASERPALPKTRRVGRTESGGQMTRRGAVATSASYCSSKIVTLVARGVIGCVLLDPQNGLLRESAELGCRRTKCEVEPVLGYR